MLSVELRSRAGGGYVVGVLRRELDSVDARGAAGGAGPP